MRTPRRRNPAKKRQGRPIVLPQSFAPKAAEADQPILGPEQANQIQTLVDLLKRNHLTELEIERAGLRVRVRYEPAARTVSAQGTELPHASATVPFSTPATPQTVAPDTSGLITITSPIVGTFYRSPSPDADPYVEEGDYVKKGQVLCIVEAMKLMNEIESEVDGRISKILAESTKPVEYGQPLFLIDPNATP
ncbi:MAG: acetyl-CoA carboxylase biotin carboxyl carrier protein [Nitrospiraceae bacterium]